MFGDFLNELISIGKIKIEIKDNKEEKEKEKENENKKEVKEVKEEKEKENNKQNEKNELDIYYSSYGYIKIEKPENSQNNLLFKFSQYKINCIPKNSLIGNIYFKNIRKEINIQIKTFFNQRKIYPLEKISIYSPLYSAIEKIFEQKKENEENKSEKNIEHITSKSQYRIFSCHKQIKELDISLCIYENEIQDNEILLYLPIKELSFSQYIKGSSIQISQKGKIASKVNTDSPQYVLGDLYYTFGKHYFEFNLLTEPIASSVIIGVATKRNQKDKYLYDVNNFYGLILSDGVLIFSEKGKQYKKDYNKKETFGINDIVGVLIEFKKEGLYISFYKNKICLGIAYSKLNKENVYYPAVSLGIAGSKIQISNQIDFP